MENLLELALRQVEQAEVFETRSESTRVHFEANLVKQLERRQTASIALRVVRDGRIGFAAASGTFAPATLVRMAVETSKFGAAARLRFPEAAAFERIRTYDDALAGFSADDLIETGTSVVQRVTSRYPDVQCEGLVSLGEGTVRIVNSAGLDMSLRRTNLGLMMEGIRVNGTDMLFVGDEVSSSFYVDAAETVASTMLLQLDRASQAASIATGKYPVLFTPHGVGIALLMPIAVAFNGKNVLEKSSRLVGRQGEQVFDPALTIFDDPTLEGRPTSSPFDDEGVPTRRVNLVNRGIVGEFLYDLQTAAQAGATTTGSGRRSDGRSQVRPGTSAVVIESGNLSFEQLLKQMGDGIVVEELIGAGQGNLLAGDFGGNVLLGYRVEDGRIVGRVKDTMIAGNIFEVLGRNVAVGNDARWVGSTLWTPSLLCEGVSVSAGGGAT